MWKRLYGPVPKGMGVLHRCDQPLCIEPTHLFLGTQQDNISDMMSKGHFGNQNTGKTHCLRGHPLSGANLYLYKDGHRRCIACLRQRDKKYKAAKKSSKPN